jgi:hypothetical protein
MLRKIKSRILLLLMVIVIPSIVYPGPIRLEWDHSASSGVTGYHIYWGTTSGIYGAQKVTTGYVQTAMVSGLNPGTGYFFAATAFDAEGNESGYSNEIHTIIGDLNLDGPVNALDLQIMVNTVLGVASQYRADLNDSGVVDVLDLQLLANVLLSGS